MSDLPDDLDVLLEAVEVMMGPEMAQAIEDAHELALMWH